MNWVLEEMVRGQWVVVSRHPDFRTAKRAMQQRGGPSSQYLQVRKKPLSESAVA